MPVWTDQAPGGISAKQPEPKGALKERLLASISVAPPETVEKFNFRHPETGKENWGDTMFGEDRIDPPDDRPQVFINTKAFEAAGASPAYFDKVVLGESLHNLKHIDPERYDRMEKAALADPTYRRWAEESALHEGVHPDNFAEWHRRSRFDQVIGGWLQAGDPDIPSMSGWSRTDLPFGKPLTEELKKLASDLDMD
jgi:hypothetical protein